MRVRGARHISKSLRRFVSGAPAASGFVAHVDQIGPNFVRGWAADRGRPGHSLYLRVYLDDKLVAEGEAATPRDDLKAAGWDEGRHAYHFPAPTKALFCAQRLKLAAVDGASETTILDMDLHGAETRTTPVLYLDASDLIEFLTHHREISGIQRVQAGYLLGLGDSTVGGAGCRICTRVKFRNWYYEISQAEFARLLAENNDPITIPPSAWPDHIQRFKDGLAKRADFRRGDTIFTLGAPWALDFHNELTRCTKLHYGARYYQIFYDLIPISVPEVVPAPLIPHFARAMAAMSVYSDHIFSISEYAKGDLAQTLQKLGRPVPPIDVVPMGGSIDDAGRGAGGAPPPRPDLAGPFVLCVGTLEPRKNHILLFHVWRRLVAKYGAQNVPKIVMVGRVGWYMEDFMRTLKVTNSADGTIVHLTGISNTELAGLYERCLFTIFPSFSEGWGLPITESLAYGKVCVCSNVASMPEAGGAHALYIDPFDTSAAFELCDKLIHDGETLAAHEASLHGYKPPTWREAAQGLRRQLDAIPAPGPAAPRQPVQFGRTYKFYNIEAAEPDASSVRVFGNFLDQEDALDLLAGWAWFDLDVNCTWACGPTAELSLVLPGEPQPEAIVAYIEVVASPLCEGAACDVLVDGREIGTFKADGLRQLAVPAPVSAAGQPMSLVFRLREPRSPQGADLRMLGLGIRTVTVFDAADLAGRIALLEKGVLKLDKCSEN